MCAKDEVDVGQILMARKKFEIIKNFSYKKLKETNLKNYNYKNMCTYLIK